VDSEQSLIPTERIEQRIFALRGQKVMLDTDLAQLYEVETKTLNRSVKRNQDRFPLDFMFQLSDQEYGLLKIRFGDARWGGRRFPPYAFTEQGVAMLSSVLHSPRAVRVNIEIMRAFVHLREVLSSHRDLARRLEELEEKYDEQFARVFEAIRELMSPALPERNSRIGFAAPDPSAKQSHK
jgi:hypothetical protein